MERKKMRILITRPRAQAAELESLLREKYGCAATFLFQPTITIGPPADSWTALDAQIAALADFQWVVFSSTNGVDAFRKRLETVNRSENKNAAIPPALKFAAIGPGTAGALQDAGFSVDFMPEVFRAEDLAEGLKTEAKKGASFLLIRASRGREILAETLEKEGGRVTQTVAYSSVDVTPESSDWNPENLEEMQAGRIDWTTITSSAIASASVRLFGDALRNTRLASISPITTATLEKLGFRPSAEAKDATMKGLVEALF